jgi:small subunit ribosomal protein S7
MRKKKNHQRNIGKDLKYENTNIAKLINNLMLAGNKGTVEKFIYKALIEVAKITGATDISLMFEKIMSNVNVSHELRSRRVGGATYQVPKVLEEYRSISRTIKFLVKNIRKISGKTLDEAIKIVLLDAYNKTGNIYSAYVNLSTEVESNRVNAVYRW